MQGLDYQVKHLIVMEFMPFIIGIPQRERLEYAYTSSITARRRRYRILEAHRGSASNQRFMFTGHPWDAESQLYHAPFRAYSPAIARWANRGLAGWRAPTSPRPGG